MVEHYFQERRWSGGGKHWAGRKTQYWNWIKEARRRLEMRVDYIIPTAYIIITDLGGERKSASVNRRRRSSSSLLSFCLLASLYLIYIYCLVPFVSGQSLRRKDLLCFNAYDYLLLCDILAIFARSNIEIRDMVMPTFFSSSISRMFCMQYS